MIPLQCARNISSRIYLLAYVLQIWTKRIIAIVDIIAIVVAVAVVIDIRGIVTIIAWRAQPPPNAQTFINHIPLAFFLQACSKYSTGIYRKFTEKIDIH
jgi:hypothetical protein